MRGRSGRELRVFADRLRQRMAVAPDPASGAGEDLERAMRAQVRQLEHLEALVEPVFRELIRPAMDLLATCIPHAHVAHARTPSGFVSRLTHDPDDALPVTVELTAGIECDEQADRASLYTHLDLVPPVLTVERTARLDLSADREGMRAWLESRIMNFADAYAKLRALPAAITTGIHVDPVCGMRVLEAATPHRLVRGTLILYFCSAACRRHFLTASK